MTMSAAAAEVSQCFCFFCIYSPTLSLIYFLASPSWQRRQSKGRRRGRGVGYDADKGVWWWQTIMRRGR